MDSKIIKVLQIVWNNFKKDTALWIGAASIIFGVFSSVGVIFSILAFNNNVQTNELLNRPYLNPNVPWFILLDKNGTEYVEGQNPKLGDVKYFRLATKVTNFGHLPAERIAFTLTTYPYAFSFEDAEENTIYDELKTESEEMLPIEKLGDIFKDKNEFMADMEIKYRLPGSVKIYTAYSHSKCKVTLVNTSLQIKCGLISEGTN